MMTQDKKKVPPTGPDDARIYIVGEAPGQTEEIQGIPFVGASGVELTRMLQEVGIERRLCRINNVVPYRPPGNNLSLWWPEGGQPNDLVKEGIRDLCDDIARVRPNLIVGCGDAPLRALTGRTGITKWRGSRLYADIPGLGPTPYLPILHPAFILRMYDKRWITLHDLRAARKYGLQGEPFPRPQWDFILRPSFEAALGWINARLRWAEQEVEPLHISADVETRGGHIACLGLADSPTHAICIPFMCIEDPDGYWSLEEELALILAVRELMMHPNVRISGQNWAYDAQYIAKHWGFLANLWRDTMITHHTCFAGLPKGLDFLSSLYLDDHVYWKDEGKTWNPKTTREDQLWSYNCQDACRTWAIAEVQTGVLRDLGFTETAYGAPVEIQHRMFHALLEAMLRGVRVNVKRMKFYERFLEGAIKSRQKYLESILGHTINPRSPKQLQELFYGAFGIRPIFDQKTGKPTCNEGALDSIGRREALLRPVTDTIIEIRSLGVFKSVCAQPLDHDARIRCSYAVTGTETFRLSSSEDAFGFGTNLQNISKGGGHGDFKLPNLRKIFLPDLGYRMADFDLKQADAQVVAWEADDEELKAIFRDPKADLHNENAKAIFGRVTKELRQKAKMGVHATNYAVTPPTLAKALGVTVHEADDFIKRWFAAHPRIKRWQEDVQFQLASRRYVENRFGYRRFYFDRIDNLLKEALAWIPQSTVGIVTNLGIMRVIREEPEVQFLLQTHDSATYQFPRADEDYYMRYIPALMRIEIPYDDPLIIPVEGKAGHNWGAC